MDTAETLNEILAQLKKVYSLLQRLPEIQAAAMMIEADAREYASRHGWKYEETINLCPPNQR